MPVHSCPYPNPALLWVGKEEKILFEDFLELVLWFYSKIRAIASAAQHAV
jgi:hypothetical protein